MQAQQLEWKEDVPCSKDSLKKFPKSTLVCSTSSMLNSKKNMGFILTLWKYMTEW